MYTYIILILFIDFYFQRVVVGGEAELVPILRHRRLQHRVQRHQRPRPTPNRARPGQPGQQRRRAARQLDTVQEELGKVGAEPAAGQGATADELGVDRHQPSEDQVKVLTKVNMMKEFLG